LTNDEDIFAENYGKGKKKTEPEPDKEKIVLKARQAEREKKKLSDVSEKILSEEKKTEVNKEEKIPKKEVIKPTVGKAKVVGVSVIAVIIAVIAIMASGVIELGEPEIFDASGCQFGVKSGFLEQRCMTENEYQIIQEQSEIGSPKSETTKSNEPFKEVSSTSDQVHLELINGIAGYFMVSSCCDWYGDFVDVNKVPKKIENAGNTKVNFICFNDEHLETQTYFGTFKNVLDPVLVVDVFINEKKVESKTTASGSALILEGNCKSFD